MKQPAHLIVGAVVAALLVTLGQLEGLRIARAGEAEEPVRLFYQAAGGCPDESSFVAKIRARSPRARVAWPGEPAREFTIALDDTPRPSGSATVRAVDRTEGTRHVEARTCAEVADALALVVALAIDPHASATSSPPPMPSQPVSPPPPATVTAFADRAPSAPPADSSDGHSVNGGSRGTLAVGADLAVVEGVAPTTLVGGSPYVGWRMGRLRAAHIEPSMRLAFVRAASGPLTSTTGTATFEWTVGRLDGCLAWPTAVLRLALCARLEAGALEATGGSIDFAATHVRPWLAAGSVARVEWSILPALFVDAEIAGLVRSVTDRFVFLPNTTVYEVPLLGLGAGVGVGVAFL